MIFCDIFAPKDLSIDFSQAIVEYQNMAVSQAELGHHAPTPPEVRQTPAATPDSRNTFLENLQSVIEARNNQIASALSLAHNEPNEESRTRVQQEKDRIKRTGRGPWKRTEDPLEVGERVLIPIGTPVGLGSVLDSYITEKPLEGTLINGSGGYGGMLYPYRSNQLTEPLFKVSVQPEGQDPTEPVTLLVPNDLLPQALQA